MRELCPGYALSVKHRHEGAVRSALAFKGFEELVPTYRARRRWSDRVKEIELPLFAGYVFCRFRFAEQMQVMDAPGVARVAAFGGEPAEVSEGEIAAIRAVMAAKLQLCPRGVRGGAASLQFHDTSAGGDRRAQSRLLPVA
jgi:transcription termination/antitermination protein NusG